LIPSLGSNAVEVVALTLRAQQSNPAGGIRHGISETGLSADEAHKARFDLRQYLGFLADDIEYVEFYRLYDGTTGGVSFIQPTSGLGYTPLQNFTAMAGLVSDLAPIKNAPVVAYAADGTGSGLTTVASYTGTYPLDVVQLVGSRPGAPANSELVAVYQRSSCTGAPCWATLASPALGQVTLTIPSGLTIAKVVDLVTRAPVGFATAGLNVTLDVSDDPVELLLAP
jgi:hypothetical protein